MNINLALTDAKEKAEESALLKSQFISTISHELRTPLYGVVGITNMLVDDHKELAESPHLNSLKFSARYLLSLVNDILQINKIDEKKITLENETFNIHEELNIIVHSLKFLANKNENSIYVEVDANIPKLLIGDKLRLAQIIMNLGSNALKFTNEGKVIIRVVQTNIINNWHYIQFQVIDNGIGIAKSDQEKIYDKFVQVGKKVHDYQGTGLGLSIVKKLIELFNSQIYVTSDVNVGTTFTFTIAFKAGEDKVVETSVVSETNLTTNHSIKVLVVEDNKINQIVTKKIIEKNNFECEVVDNGIIALERLESESYDVILMDINMPIINGFETTRQIREKGILIPVIALTAFDRDEITDEAYSSGMNDIIIKPFEPIKAFQIINAEVNKYKSNI
jgi:CheY-like chemotaxis protein/two-component sensor histidine kinase